MHGKKSTEPPNQKQNMTDETREIIKDCRSIFRTKGRRIREWLLIKKKPERIVDKQKAGYNRMVLQNFMQEKDSKKFTLVVIYHQKKLNREN